MIPSLSALGSSLTAARTLVSLTPPGTGPLWGQGTELMMAPGISHPLPPFFQHLGGSDFLTLELLDYAKSFIDKLFRK